MATYNFNLTLNEVVEEIYGLLGMSSEDRDLTPYQYEKGRRWINIWLQNERLEIVARNIKPREITFTGTSYNTNGYLQLPGEVLNVDIASIEKTSDAAAVVLEKSAQRDFFELDILNDEADLATHYFYDKDDKKVYFYPNPNDTIEYKLKYNAYLKFQDLTNPAEDVFLESEWVKAIIFGVAKDLGHRYKVPQTEIEGLRREREDAIDKANNLDSDFGTFKIVPDRRAYDYGKS